MMVMEKGVCRQLLDWLIEQIEILDQHIEAMAGADGDFRRVKSTVSCGTPVSGCASSSWTRSKPAASRRSRGARAAL